MTVISDVNIAALLLANGWSTTQAPTGVAVILAESGGNPDAENGSTTATGLFQIMFSIWSKDKDVAALGVKTRADLHNPVINVKAGAIILHKQGWKAWDTYNHGSHTKFMARGNAAVKAASTQDATNKDTGQSLLGTINDWTLNLLGKGGSAAKSVASKANPLDGVGSAIKDFTSTVTKITENIGVIIIVVVLLSLGIFILTRNTSTGKAIGTVAKVAAVV